MADNTRLNPAVGTDGDLARSVQKGGGAGPKTTVVALDIGGYAGELLASAAAPVPVSLITGYATQTTLAAILAKLNTTIDVNIVSGGGGGGGTTDGLTNAELRASAVSVSVSNFPSTAGLTNTELRSTAVPVAGTIALDSATLAALENIQASVTGTFFQATQPVSGTFWQATQPISATALPLPTGAATQTTLAAIDAKLGGTLTVTAAAGGATSAKQDLQTGLLGDILTANGGAEASWLSQLNLKTPALVNGSTPIIDPDVIATGTITVTDAVVAAPAGDGALRSGASTAGSIVAIACPGGDSAWNVQVTGLTSGTLYFEVSLDSTNGTDGSWANVNGRMTGLLNTQLAGSATTNGVFRGNTSGAKYMRVRSVGALSGTPAIVLRISAGIGAIFLNASIPAGNNSIGTVGADATKSDLYVTGQGAQLALNNNILLPTAGAGATDAMGYRSAFVSITTASGTVTAGALAFEHSGDGVNWLSMPAYEGASVTLNHPFSSFSVAASTTRIIYIPTFHRYIRVRISTAITGTTTGVQAFLQLRQASSPTWGTATVLLSGGNGIGSVTVSGGQTAHSAASTGNPMRVAGRVNTAVDTTLVAGDASDIFMTTGGAQVQKPFAVPELDWQYAAAAGGIVDTADVAVKTAAAAGVRNYVTGLDVHNAHASVATEVVIKDGSTVIWRGHFAPGAKMTRNMQTPLRGTAATAINVACLTTGSAIYVNLQGYTAP